MECSVCLRNWSGEDCVPRSLPCGHSFCDQCLSALFARKKVGIDCPTCLVQHKMTQSELQSLPKNYSLLALLRDKVSTRKSPLPSSGIDISSKQLPLIPVGEPDKLDVEREQIEKMVSSHPLCEKHKMLIHSFVPGTKYLLCDKCLTELPKSVSSIVAIPKAIYSLLSSIIGVSRAKTAGNSCKKHACTAEE